MVVKFIKKRDGTLAKFDLYKIENAVSKAAKGVHIPEYEKISSKIASEVIKNLNQKYNGNHPTINEIDETIINLAKEMGYESLSKSYQNYNQERKDARKTLSIMKKQKNGDTTDTALLIESDSKYTQSIWDKDKVIDQLQREANLGYELAAAVSKKVENLIIGYYKTGIRRLNTGDIRGLVDLVLRQEGLESERKKQGSIVIPKKDLENAFFGQSHENSNVSSNNPEAVNLFLAEQGLKQYALDDVFSQEVKEAHLEGRIHLHDLGYIDRVYCSSHSLEYIKKYGLDKVLSNLESKSNPPNSAAVLNQHVQTFLASMQANYAGALGFGFLNILYSPLLNRSVEVIEGEINGTEFKFEKNDLEKLIEQEEVSTYENSNEIKYFKEKSRKKILKELPYKEFKQVAQNLIFASSQNAFSRGGQTLFIDFNIHTGVPHYLRNVPAIGSGGNYMIQNPDGTIELKKEVPRFMNPEDETDSRNGDADSSNLEGKILTYGDFEKTSQKFAKALLDVWKEGDKDGRPFHFPKCDIHIDENSFKDPEQEKLVDYAAQISAENGSPYFMFDRGDGAILAQCCRLKEKIIDQSMLKYPEKLRFCGFQNVTINLAQAAYRGKTLEKTLNEIDVSMDLALEAHFQKKKIIGKFLETKGSPLRSLGQKSDDGNPYLDIEKATYIIGNIGLNEAVQVITGKQLHENEIAYQTGLKIISRMYKNVNKFKKNVGLKLTLEETPAESATRRLAKVDLNKFKEAKEIVKGTEKNPYYTNSIHFAPDAQISIIDRIIGQSKFHDMIESGAITHAYIGEKRPDKNAMKSLIKKTLEDTRCAQLVFSPTYTECDLCGNIMAGEKEICTDKECLNNSNETLNKDTLFSVTRVVGYYSRIDHWNGSQKQINEDRKKAEGYYAGEKGDNMNWLHNPNGFDKTRIIQFSKKGCKTCDNLESDVKKKLDELKVNGNAEFEVHHLDELNEAGLVKAAEYGVPLDTVPTLVIANKKGFWKKTTEYAPKMKKECKDNSCGITIKPRKSNLIRPNEIKEQLEIMLKE